MPKKDSVSDQIVTLDRRRGNRREEERRVGEPTEAQLENLIASEVPKIKKQRRRQIDPTTCEREYTDPEVEFMQAMDAYKRRSGRMFPTCSEVLEVIRDLGYVKQSLVAAETVDLLQMCGGD